MQNVWLIARREISVMLRRATFYLATFLIPAITGLIFFGSSLLSAAALGGDSDNAGAGQPVGLVDQAGVVQRTPPGMEYPFITYENEQDATAALRNGKISSYFMIAPDYRQTGQVVQVSDQVSIGGASSGAAQALRTLLRTNLVNDVALATRLDDPLNLDVQIVGSAAAQERAQQPGVNTGISFALALLLAFAILNGGGWLIQAISEEKENRTIEVVLTSIRPWQLMAGKLLGLGTISLLQLAIWMSFSIGVLGAGRAVGQISFAAVAPQVWLWLVVFFLLGFLFFGALMAMLGAVGASARESGQMSSFLTIPMLLPLWFGTAITNQPDGMLATVLSLIPFTAPVTMLLRLNQSDVPLWQLLLSVALMGLAVLGAIWLAARLFRATTLLTGVKPTPRSLWQAVRG